MSSNRKEQTKNQILDAAIRCYQDIGAINTSMVDIVAEAGIGRTTLYRHFKSHEEILIHAIIRDIYDVIEQLMELNERQSSLEDKIIESFLFCITEFKRRPVLNLLFNQDASTLVNNISLKAADFNELGAKFSQPIFDEALAAGRIREGVDLAQFVEWNTRFLISIQTTPSPQQEDGVKMRQFLRNFLVPSLLTVEDAV